MEYVIKRRRKDARLGDDWNIAAACSTYDLAADNKRRLESEWPDCDFKIHRRQA